MSAATALAPVPAPPRFARRRAGTPEPALVTRLGAFAAMSAFAAGHWFGLVAGAPGWRVAAIVVTATAGGLALAATGRLRERRPLAAAATQIVVVPAMVALGLLAAGLPGRLLPPGRWDELGEGIDRGLAGVPSVSWPYAGGDEWVGLTILLAAPVCCALAATLAFWPAGRVAPALRFAALILLVALYGVAATEHDFGTGLGRGLVLFLLIALWLWLPRLRRMELAVGLAALFAVGLLSLPLAAGADGDDAWVDYRSWQWFGGESSASFNWDHTYGPIDWQRDGTTLMLVRSPKAHYWKAETLDSFDGLRWFHSTSGDRSRVTVELPERIRPEWISDIDFTVRGLRTSLVVGAGTTVEVDGTGLTSGSADGTVRALDEPLEEGDTYSVRAYVPDPKPHEMRRSLEVLSPVLVQYTQLALPNPGATALEARSTAPLTPEVVTVPSWGGALPGSAQSEQRILASPYARVYRLARRLAVGQATAYDVVKRIETHLQRSYRYTERPPSREFPLAAFLFEDRAGYCQQFSGAMALMLRMNGIPARVAAGFTPGSYNRDTREYRVRDLDAHSWVEVYFAGLGWVPFDPTPSLAPAESQLGGARIPSAAQRDPAQASPDAGDSPVSDRASDGAERGAGGDGSGALSPLALAAVAAGAVAALGAWVLLRRRRAGARTPDAALMELRRALRRLGYEVDPGTTLAELERRLAVVAGAEAARYVRRLARQLYARGGGRPPDRRARRALRRALTAGRNPARRVRGYLALPPRPFAGLRRGLPSGS